MSASEVLDVLMIDDKDFARFGLPKLMLEYGLRVEVVPRAGQLIAALRRQRYDIVLLDFLLAEGPTGLDLIPVARERRPDAAVVLWSDYFKPGGYPLVRARALGARAVLDKGADPAETAELLRRSTLPGQHFCSSPSLEIDTKLKHHEAYEQMTPAEREVFLWVVRDTGSTRTAGEAELGRSPTAWSTALAGIKRKVAMALLRTGDPRHTRGDRLSTAAVRIWGRELQYEFART